MASDNRSAPRRKAHGFSSPMRVALERDFERAFRGGSRARAEFLLVVAVENELGWSRLGLSVGRRIFKSAVKRNRLKRILREAFRLEYPSLPQGLDLILIPAAPRVAPSLAAARSELVYLSNKAARRLAEKRAAASSTPQ